MKNENDVKILYEINEEIIKNDGDIKITFNDKDKTITFDIDDKFKNSLVKVDELDSKSIVKDSEGKYYCYSLSKPGVQRYWTIDDIEKEIEDNHNKYLKILVPTQGKFSNNTWTFDYKILFNYKYYFLIDSNKFTAQRPYMIEVSFPDWKLPAYYLNYPVYSNTSLIGVLSITIEPNMSEIKVESDLLEQDSEITIYESLKPVF